MKFTTLKCLHKKKIKKNTNKCLNDASQEFGKAHRNQEQWRARNNKSQPPPQKKTDKIKMKIAMKRINKCKI